MIDSDKEALKYSLKGIIRCRHILNMDASTYENEYASYHFMDTKVVKEQTKELKPKPEVKALPQPKPQPKSNIHTIEKINIKSNDITPKQASKNYVKNIEADDNNIKITFSKKLTHTDVLFFELNFHDKYKDIYDIKAILPKNIKHNIKVNGLKRVQISQNSKQKIRLVLEDPKVVKSTAFTKDNTLIIHIENLKTKVTKAHQTVKRQKTLTNKTTKQKPNPKVITVKNLFKNNTYKRIKKYSKLIVIDPGHGGHDSGAIGYNHIYEKRAVLEIGLKLKQILQKKGFRVFMTRSRDNFISLASRPHLANIKKADLFISIHANSVDGKRKLTVKGIETYYLSPADSARAKRVAAKENSAALKEMDYSSKNTLLNFLNREKIIQSNKLAIDIQANVLKTLRKKYSSIIDGGVRPAPFRVLTGAGMPAILIETGYISNPTEAKRLTNPFYQKTLAQGIANGVESYFLKN